MFSLRIHGHLELVIALFRSVLHGSETDSARREYWSLV